MKTQLKSVWSRLCEKLGTSYGIQRRHRRQPQTLMSAAHIELLEGREMLTAGLPTGSPTPPPPVHTFYIDPIHGSSSGNGTQAHPWQTLQAVISAGLINGQDSTKGVVHGGDLIYLMNGYQGTVTLNGNSLPFRNSQFITIQAYPGTHPVMTSLNAQNVSNWAFRGLTFTAPPTVGSYYVMAQFTQSSSNIVFDHNTISAQSSPAQWSPQDWINKSPYRAINFSGTNATITNNTMTAVRNGVCIDGNNIVLSGNTIDDFADDGIDFTSSNTLIQRNTITNHYGQLPDGNHNDAIQGWTNVGVNNSNVTIDSNVVIASTGTDPGVSLIPTGNGQDHLQGISIFDGVWTNVTVTNNVVAAASNHGIAMYGLSNSVIANNTVVKDASDPTINTWLLVAPNRTGAPSQNVIVRNNIANMFNMTTAGVTDDHNISLSRNNYWGGGSTNKVVLDPTKVFVNYSTDPTKCNFRLKAGSAAIASGTSLTYPATDILGIARVSSKVDIGAYSYVAPRK